jgi:hypothetical protein
MQAATTSCIFCNRHSLKCGNYRVDTQRGWGLSAGWKKSHPAEFHDFQSSTSIMKMTNLKEMRWAKHVARMGESRDACRILVGSPEQRDHLEYLAINEKNDFKVDFKEAEWRGLCGG